MTVELYRSYGLHAEVNPAPEEDYDSRASHDIVVEGELHDVKADFWVRRTKRIFVERASLEHTKAYWFDYWLLTAYGYDIRVFSRQQLIDYYNAKTRIARGDGMFYERYVYEHGIAGLKINTTSFILPPLQTGNTTASASSFPSSARQPASILLSSPITLSACGSGRRRN